MTQRPRVARLFLPFGFIALMMAMWGGMTRIGWPLPMPHASLLLAHGPLMVSGFLGTVIGLERAVALGKLWGYAAPLLSAGAVVALIAGSPTVGISLFVAASLVLAVIYLVAHRLQPAVFTIVMGFGALAWAVGNLLYLTGQAVFLAVPWWMAFLILTIIGERLELSRVRPPSPSRQTAFMIITIIYMAGVTLSLPTYDTGIRLSGAALLGFALWLWRHDVARTTIKQPGLTRFMAMALLAGYAWLGLAGALFLLLGGLQSGLYYDAQIHAVFLGFVFSAHAPIILPAVTGIRVAFRRAFYLHLGLLHASLGLRVIADLAGWHEFRAWAGLLNGLAIIVFMINTALATHRIEYRRSLP